MSLATARETRKVQEVWCRKEMHLIARGPEQRKITQCVPIKNERGTDAMEWNRKEHTKRSPTPGAERGRLGPGVGTSGLTILEATTKSALVVDEGTRSVEKQVEHFSGCGDG